MKKFILPVLIVVTMLTSCSQALYKNKYDWVKVDRNESPSIVDPTRNTVNTLKEIPTALNEKTGPPVTDILVDRLVVDDLSITPLIPADTSGKQKKERKDEQAQKTKKQSPKVGAIQQKPLEINFSKRSSGPSRSSGMSTEEKGYIAAGIGLVLLLILIVALGPATVLPVIYLVVRGFLAIMSIVAIVMMIYGICWFFGQFIFMMDH